MEQVIQLRIDLAAASGSHADALQGAEDLLAFEESLSGTTSVRYMRAAQTAANVYQAGGRPERALALHRQIISIADLTLPPSDPQRGHLRINAAFAFANARRFDDAEQLANEAAAVGGQTQPPNLFASQVERIRQMKAAAR